MLYEVITISPLQYLRAIRLNAVRRQLRRERHASVADVASAWGFTHLVITSYSIHYTKLYEEIYGWS